MADVIEFTDNYEDLSTDTGFQFKFLCERCGNGYMSSFQDNKLGMLGGAMRAASGLLGGVFSRGADSAYEVQQAIGGRQHDAALRKAVAEIRPLFVQCKACGNWCCREVCWNEDAAMCKNCAPVAEEVETRVRAQHVETQVANDLFLEENVRMSAKGKAVAAKCSQCGEPTMGKKFCPSCGAPTESGGSAFCGECGAKLTPGAAFCGDCGAKVS